MASSPSEILSQSLRANCHPEAHPFLGLHLILTTDNSKLCSVPPNRRLVQVDVNLLCFQIFLEPPRTEFPSKTGLLVAAPGCFHVGRLHVIDPDNSSAKRLYDPESFKYVTSPHRARQAVRRVVGNLDGVALVLEGNHGRHRPKYFFAGNARAVADIIKDRRLDVITLAKRFRPATSNCGLCLFFPEFQVRTHAVILLLAHQRPHLGLALEWRA